jgi:uroporphyrinogen decarboxylase
MEGAMTPRERVYRSLEFQESDIVPYHIETTHPAHRKLVDYYGDSDILSKLGNHLAFVSVRKIGAWVELEPGHLRDEWGVVWNRTVDKDIGVVERYLLAEPSLDGFECPPVCSTVLSDIYKDFVGQNADRFRIISIGFSLFERAWTLRGMEAILQDMLDSPQFVHELFDALTEWNLAHVDVALQQDIDAIYFGDDWGSQNGLIMGPRLWREFIKPYIERIYERVRSAGKYVMIHSCGDVREILPDLVEAGLNVFNPFQPEVMDVFETKKRYFGKLSFNGAISVQHLLPHGTPEQVRTETRRLLDTLGAGGGYIASPSHAIPSDVPIENIVALIETLQNQ